MSKKKQNKPNESLLTAQKPYLNVGHGPALNRRDLLGRGATTALGYISMPSILTLLSERALGITCPDSGGDGMAAQMPAFLSIDVAGGFNIAGNNVIVGLKNNEGTQSDFLSAAAYETLGLPPTFHPSVAGKAPNNAFGLLFHPDSGILRGLMDATSATTRANIDGVVFCTESADDLATNPLNPNFWISKAGANGELARMLGSSGDGKSAGGRSLAPASSFDPSYRRVQISRTADINSLVDKGILATRILNDAEVKKVLQAAHSMSGEKIRAFQAKALPDQIKVLAECGYIQSVDVMTKYDASKIDPLLDPLVADATTGAYRRDFNSQMGGVKADSQRAAAIAKTVLDGLAGVGTFEIGGGDYHAQGRPITEAKDYEVGLRIGQALELAAKKARDLMVYVFTDGGVSSNQAPEAGGQGRYGFNADKGEKAAAFALVYKKDGKPQMRGNRRQIGAFANTGSVDRASSLISTNVEALTKAVVANYLALLGKESELAKIVGTDPFGANLDQYLAFQKLR